MRANDFVEYHLKNSNLTEDGFCSLCLEFYSDCECVGIFARMYKEMKKRLDEEKQRNKDIKLKDDFKSLNQEDRMFVMKVCKCLLQIQKEKRGGI